MKEWVKQNCETWSDSLGLQLLRPWVMKAPRDCGEQAMLCVRLALGLMNVCSQVHRHSNWNLHSPPDIGHCWSRASCHPGHNCAFTGFHWLCDQCSLLSHNTKHSVGATYQVPGHFQRRRTKEPPPEIEDCRKAGKQEWEGSESVKLFLFSCRLIMNTWPGGVGWQWW